MENGHEDLDFSRSQSAALFPSTYYPPDSLGWNIHANDVSNDVDSTENGSPQRVLTRRQRAAMSVGRAMGNETAQTSLYSAGIDFTSLYGLPSHLDPLSSPMTPSSSLNLHINPSANPADISPPARRSHARHSSDAFSPRASSPASSIGTSSSSIASLLSYSTSTWSSTTGESSPARSTAELKSKHTKNKLRNSDRKDMCVFAEQFPDLKQEDIAIKYGVERSTVSKVLKNKAHWMSLEDEDQLKIIKHRPIKFPDVETAVLKWMHERSAAGEPLSDTTLREQARTIARQLGIGDDQFKASGGWIENFKQRHKIRRGKFANERAERGVSARRASFSPSAEAEEVPARRVISSNGIAHRYSAEETYAQMYGSGHFRPFKLPPSADEEHESITSSAGSGSAYMDDVAPLMATFSLAEKSPSTRGMLPPATNPRASNSSPRSSVNKSSPRISVNPTASNNGMSTSASAAAAATALEHTYGTRSKTTINAFQLEQSVRLMRTFIQDVHPDGFTDEQREVWGVIERRTLEWAEAQKRAAPGTPADAEMGYVGLDGDGDGKNRVGRTRSKAPNGL